MITMRRVMVHQVAGRTKWWNKTLIIQYGKIISKEPYVISLFVPVHNQLVFTLKSIFSVSETILCYKHPRCSHWLCTVQCKVHICRLEIRPIMRDHCSLDWLDPGNAKSELPRVWTSNHRTILITEKKLFGLSIGKKQWQFIIKNVGCKQYYSCCSFNS